MSIENTNSGIFNLIPDCLLRVIIPKCKEDLKKYNKIKRKTGFEDKSI